MEIVQVVGLALLARYGAGALYRYIGTAGSVAGFSVDQLFALVFGAALVLLLGDAI